MHSVEFEGATYILNKQPTALCAAVGAWLLWAAYWLCRMKDDGLAREAWGSRRKQREISQMQGRYCDFRGGRVGSNVLQ